MIYISFLSYVTIKLLLKRRISVSKHSYLEGSTLYLSILSFYCTAYSVVYKWLLSEFPQVMQIRRLCYEFRCAALWTCFPQIEPNKQRLGSTRQPKVQHTITPSLCPQHPLLASSSRFLLTSTNMTSFCPCKNLFSLKRFYTRLLQSISIALLSQTS